MTWVTLVHASSLPPGMLPDEQAERLVELRHIDGASYETVRQVLKKNRLRPWPLSTDDARVKLKWVYPSLDG